VNYSAFQSDGINHGALRRAVPFRASTDDGEITPTGDAPLEKRGALSRTVIFRGGFALKEVPAAVSTAQEYRITFHATTPFRLIFVCGNRPVGSVV